MKKTVNAYRILITTFLLAISGTFVSKAQEGRVALGLKAGHNAVYSGYTAISIEAEQSFLKHFSISAGALYNTIGKVVAEVRPSYYHDFTWGKLSAEILMEYTNTSSINTFAAGAGLSIGSKWVYCRAGYYYKSFCSNVWRMSEPFNIYYTMAINCLPMYPKWDLRLYVTNCETFELERHYQPSFVLQGGYMPVERIGITVGIGYKPAGMFHLATDYHQIHTKAGICYRW